jgi:hypothetical protein
VDTQPAFCALTLLVATCEQALVELDNADLGDSPLVLLLERTRDEAVTLGRSLALDPDGSDQLVRLRRRK